MTAVEGPTWHVVRGVAVPEGATISARFVGGTVSGHAGVNRYRAAYTLDGYALRIGPAASTRMAGTPDRMATERDVLTLLDRVRSARVGPDGASLELLDDDGEVLLGFEAAPAVGSDLVGAWTVRAVRRDGELVTPRGDRAPGFDVSAEGRLAGTAGVNRVSGPIRLDGDRVHIGPLMVTRMAADPDRMDDEAALLRALEATASYRAEGDGIALLDADGEPVVVLGSAAGGA